MSAARVDLNREKGKPKVARPTPRIRVFGERRRSYGRTYFVGSLSLVGGDLARRRWFGMGRTIDEISMVFFFNYYEIDPNVSLIEFATKSKLRGWNVTSCGAWNRHATGYRRGADRQIDQRRGIAHERKSNKSGERSRRIESSLRCVVLGGCHKY